MLAEATAEKSALDLDEVFHPRSVAIVGASTNQRSQGYEFVQAFLSFGFPGPIYPVNPRLEAVMGLKAYPRLDDIPGPVDFVISAVPARATVELVQSAVAKGVKLIHFYTGRFSETGREDAAAIEGELRRLTREAGIRVIGPNCMGLYYPKEKITFSSEFPREPGNIAFLSQSGSHAWDLIGRGSQRGLRFSKVISYGNALDLNESDLLEYCARDAETEIIATYIEGVRDGRRFFDALRTAAENKPVVVFKGGRTTAGQAAARSHTASLASTQNVWHVAMEQAGALEVRSLNELTDMLVALRAAGPARGLRTAVLGGAGGGTVEAADLCHEAGLQLPPVPAEVREQLRDKLPHAWDWVGNPLDDSILDWGGGFDGSDIIALMAASPAYDAIIENANFDFLLSPEDDSVYRRTIERLKSIATTSGKAAMVVLNLKRPREEWRRKAVARAYQDMVAAGAALFPDMERASRTMGRYLSYMLQRQSK